MGGHATSKIQTADNLGAIRALGFRGQALSAIASLSDLRLQTRRPIDSEGTEIAAQAGKIGDSQLCSMPAGTRIEVRRLFSKSRRLKFLKGPTTEQAAIVEVFQRAALANHQVAFTLIADGRTVSELPRAISTLDRFRQLFGAALATKMLAFDRESPGIHARGLLAASDETFPSARMMFTFINGRSIRDRMLIRTIQQVYVSFIPVGRYPAAVLFVDMPGDDLEVFNPTKTEVHFSSVGRVFEVIYQALTERLTLDHNKVKKEQSAKAPPPRSRRRRKLASNVIVFPGPRRGHSRGRYDDAPEA